MGAQITCPGALGTRIWTCRVHVRMWGRCKTKISAAATFSREWRITAALPNRQSKALALARIVDLLRYLFSNTPPFPYSIQIPFRSQTLITSPNCPITVMKGSHYCSPLPLKKIKISGTYKRACLHPIGPF